MKDELQGNEPAMPEIKTKMESGSFNGRPYIYGGVYNTKGLTKIEYACIHLELPESGTPWLDKLIAKKQRQNIAEKVLQGLLAGDIALKVGYSNSETSIEFADALLSELNKPTT